MLKANPSYPAHCCCSGTKSYLTLCDLTDCSMPGFPVLNYLQEFAQTHVYWVSDAISSCYPLLLLPSIFPSIRVFSNKSVLCTKWPKYWSFSISPSNEHSGLISFRSDSLVSLQSKGLWRVFSNTTVWKHQFFGILLSLWSSSYNHTRPLGRP